MGALDTLVVTKEMIEELRVFKEKPEGASSLIEASSLSLIYFVENMVGFRLRGWQVIFLKAIECTILNKPLPEGIAKFFDADVDVAARELVALTSRQIGKTTCIALSSLWAAIFNKKPETDFELTSVIIVSRSDGQAKEVLKEVKKMVRLGDRTMRARYKDAEGKPIFGNEFFSNLLDDKEENNKTVMTFKAEQPGVKYLFEGSKTGSVIKCYPPTPAVLGQSIGIGIVDEAGHSSISGDFILDELQPTGDSTDAVWIYTSTPWNPSGWFYEMCDPRGEFGVTHVRRLKCPIDVLKEESDVRSQKQYAKVLGKVKRYRETGNADTASRSYYCEFVKGETSFFNPDHVRKIFKTDLVKHSHFDHPVDVGVDFGGQVNSRTVVTCSFLDKDDNIYRVYDKVYGVGDDEMLLADLSLIRANFTVNRIIVDDCPAGQSFIKEMENKGWEIFRFNFRSLKVSTYTAFRRKLSLGMIHSYLDSDLQEEMMSLEYETGKRQSVITPAVGCNDDKIDSFMLSAYFYVDDVNNIKSFDWDDIE